MLQSIPKGLTPFGRTTLISYQVEKFSILGCKVIVVIAPDSVEQFLAALELNKNEITICTQTILDGTARAIAGALNICDTEIVVTCWVDQAGASVSIIEDCVNVLNSELTTVAVVPLVESNSPYVRASIENEELIGWSHQREGATNTHGFSDVGIFAFRRNVGIEVLSQAIKSKKLYSKITNEMNFLDVLPLFRHFGAVKLIYSDDQALLQSFNTQAELETIKGKLESAN